MGRYHPMMENCPRQFQVGGTYQQQVEGNGRLSTWKCAISMPKACGISSTR